LGDIGNINMDQIAKAISKNRSLTAENAHLFYDVQNTTLTLYDVTSSSFLYYIHRNATNEHDLFTDLTPPGLCTLASLNPNLTCLRLEKCGRMDSTVLDSWSRSLSSLTRLELVGPFLVRAPAWQSFFASHRSLTGFLITHSPRFDLDCMKALQKHCPRLTELRLREVEKLDDEFVDVMKGLTGLTYLDLGYSTTSLSEHALVDLMDAVGAGLTHLDLSGHSSLTDTFLVDGIKEHARALTELALSNVPLLTDEGVAEFFDAWAVKDEDGCLSSPSLTTLDLSRNTNLSSAALIAILSHSGKTLIHLNINGWKTTSEESLKTIASRAKELRWLDVGWCREMDNFVMKAIIDQCKRVKEVKVWGCNRLTEHCPRKVSFWSTVSLLALFVFIAHLQRNVNIYGVEAHTQMA
jgi:DNA repair protein RAD7